MLPALNLIWFFCHRAEVRIGRWPPFWRLPAWTIFLLWLTTSVPGLLLFAGLARLPALLDADRKAMSDRPGTQ